MFSFFPSNRGCDDTHPTDGVPVGPARGQADSNTGPQRSLKVIGSSRADFPSWPGAPKTLLTRYVCSLTHSSPIWTSSSEEDFFEKGVD